MRSTGRPAILLLAAALLAAAVACSAAKDPEVLCLDLGHLRATIEIAAQPTPERGVGDVRGALYKLLPTIEAVGRSGAAGEAPAASFAAVQEVYLEALEGVGDDEPISAVPAASALGERLAAAVRDVEEALRCAIDSPTPVPAPAPATGG